MKLNANRKQIIVGGCALTVLLIAISCEPAPSPAAAPIAITERTDDFVVSPDATDQACPMQVEGADVALSFVDGGGAFIFTTATSRALPIRRAARRLSAAYDTSLPPPGATGRSAARQIQQSPLGIATRVEYSDVAAGARVEVTAIDPKQVLLLQQRLRHEVARMRRTRSCRLEPPADRRQLPPFP